MYEHFKNDLLSSLSNQFTAEQLQHIGVALDVVASKYDISDKETAVVVRENIPELVKVYLVSKKMEGCSDSTLYNQKLILFHFFETIGKSPDVVTQNDVRLYLYKYQEYRHISSRSLDKIRQGIVTFFGWAYNEDYIPKNPCTQIKKIKFEVKPRQALTQLELEYVRKRCKDLRERVIIETLYSTGCRIGELVDIKISDIDFAAKTVKIYGQKTKKYRTSFINAKAEVLIRDYLKSRTDDCPYLIISKRKPYRKLKTGALQKEFRELRSRVPEVQKILSAHVMRHTTATVAVNNGADIQNVQLILGHSSINTTMQYVDKNIHAAQEQHMKCVI